MTDKRRLLGIEDLFELGRQRTVSQQILILPPLTKPPGHYLTGYEGSPCEMLEPAKISENTIKFNIVKDPSLGANEWFLKGIDTDEFKKQCEDIDRGES